MNCSSDEVVVCLENVEASSWLYPALVDDAVHSVRSSCGVGTTWLALGPGIGGELNPPAEEELFSRFRMRVLKKSWSMRRDLAGATVARGDVLVYRDGALTQVQPRTADLSLQ